MHFYVFFSHLHMFSRKSVGQNNRNLQEQMFLMSVANVAHHIMLCRCVSFDV